MRKAIGFIVLMFSATIIFLVSFNTYAIAATVTENLTDIWLNDPNNGFVVSSDGNVVYDYQYNYGIYIDNDQPGSNYLQISFGDNYPGGTFDLKSIDITMMNHSDTFNLNIIGIKDGSPIDTVTFNTVHDENQHYKVNFSTFIGIESFKIEINSSQDEIFNFALAGFTYDNLYLTSPPSNINLSSDRVEENRAVGTVVGTLSAVDSNTGETFTYSLVSGTGDDDNSKFTVDGDQLKTNDVFDYESKNSYNVRLRVTDSSGLNYDEAVTIHVTDVNEPPTGLTLSNQQLEENQPSGTVVGTFETVDPDLGNTFTYSLVSGTGDDDNSNFSIDGDTLKTSSPLDYETNDTYSIRVRVNDGQHNYEETFTVSVLDVNDAPSDILLSNAKVPENEPAGTLVGVLSGVDDDSGETFTYELVSGSGDTDNPFFEINGNELRTADSFDYETKDSYSIRVKVTDSGGLTFEKEMAVQITNVNESPSGVVLSSSSIQENLAPGTAVGTLSGIDPDEGETFTFNLVSGEGADDNSSFTIVGNELRTSESFDYETKSSYSIRIEVSDAGGLDAEDTFTIQVTDVNEAPTALSLSSSSIDENQTAGSVIGAFSTEDPDSGNTFTYSLVSGTGDADNASFVIDGNELKTAEVFDYETKDTYSIRVKVNDGKNDLAQQFTITVQDVNDVPTGITLSHADIKENQPVGTEVGILSGVDEDSGEEFTFSLAGGEEDNAYFEISGNRLLTKESFDYETKNSYSIQIQVTDSGDLSYEETFEIQVTNVNEHPEGLQLSGGEVPENSAPGTAVGTLSGIDPDEGETFTFSLVDGEGAVDNSSFTIVGNELRTSESFDYETKSSYSIRIEVSDAGGLAAEDTFTIQVTDVNEAPTALSLSSSSIDENQATGSVIGIFSTEDPDSGNTFTYSLVNGTGDADNASFVIEDNELKTAEVFDFETKDTYSIRVNVNDGENDLAQQFTITVQDVNDAPEDINISNTSVPENSSIGTVIGTLSTTDEDAGDTFTYSLVNGTGDSDLFVIEGTELKTNEMFDYEVKDSYSVRILVTDQGGLPFEKTFTIQVTDVNENPSGVVLSSSSIQENLAPGTAVGTLSGIDPDEGETFTFSLVDGEGAVDNSSFTIVGNELRTSESFDYETKSSYSIRVRVTDAGGLTAEETFTIQVTDVNEAPTALSLSSSSIDENQATGSVIGIFSTEDPDSGNTFTYSLVNGTGDADNASFVIEDNELKTAEVFDFETKDTYSIRVNVNDGENDLAQQFTITVQDVNDAPEDINISNTSVPENSSIGTVIGTLSTTDEDAGDTFTYSLVNGTGDSDLFVIEGTELKTNEMFDYEVKDSYSVRILVTDHGGLPFEKTFTIQVTDVNESPSGVVLSSSSIQENLAPGTAVGTLSGIDPDEGETFTFSLVDGEGAVDNSSFTIVGNELRTSESFDYETQSSYSIRIEISDAGGLTAEETFTIQVTDVNEAPTALSLSSSSIDENQTAGSVIGTFSTEDPDSGNTFTYSLVSGTGDADNDSFVIEDNELKTAEVFDFETKDTYSIRVNVNDGENDLAQQFTITVQDVNDAPEGIQLSNNQIAENSPVGVEVGILSGVDEDSGEEFTFSLTGEEEENAYFEISGNRLLTKESFDFEAKNSYSIQIQVTDSGDLSYEETFEIQVTNVNEHPEGLQLSGGEVPENSAPGTAVGTLSGIDPDEGETFTFNLVSGEGADDNSSFTIVGNELRTSESFDYETQSSYSIRIEVSDAGGLAAEDTFTIQVTDVNEAPTALSLSSSSIDENQTAGSVVGTFRTEDPDNGNTFTYSLVSGIGDADNDRFVIDGNELKTAEVFDYETKDTYSIRVNVNDGENDLSQQFTITVEDVNDAPTGIMLSQADIKENQLVGTEVGTLSGVDEDSGEEFTFSLAGEEEDNAYFEISGNRLLTKESFDYETKDTYSIHIEVMDSGGEIYEDDFTIQVTDVNESVEGLELSSNEISENSPSGTVVGVLNAVDQDQNDTYTYSLVVGDGDTDNGSFVIDGDQLKTGESFDYETKASYSVRIRVRDEGNHEAEEVFLIQVTDVNEPVEGLQLTSNEVAENSKIGTTIGILEATDPDQNDTYTFEFIEGTGDQDNDRFAINGNQLKTNEVFDFETKDQYHVRIRVTDNGEFSVDQPFVIQVTDQQEPPEVFDHHLNGNEDQPVQLSVTDFVYDDEDGDDLAKVRFESLPEHGTLKLGDQPISVSDEVYREDLSSIYFDPESNWYGTTGFSWKGHDGSDYSPTNATIELEIAPVNDAPEAKDVSYSTGVDVPLSGMLLAEDVDGDALTFSIVQQGTKGTVSIVDASTGEFYYVPETGVTGNDTVTFNVYDENHAISNDANLNIQIVPSGVADLAALTTSEGEATPNFDPNVLSYSLDVEHDVEELTVTASVYDPYASVAVNGVNMGTGGTSDPIPMNVGSNPMNIVVTAQDGVTSKTYQLDVIRAPSSNASLAGLQVGTGRLTPAFDPEQTTYSLRVGYYTRNIAIDATAEDSNATLMVNGEEVSSGGSPVEVGLDVGLNKINVTVSAQDGVTTKAYTIHVIRLPLNNRDDDEDDKDNDDRNNEDHQEEIEVNRNNKQQEDTQLEVIVHSTNSLVEESKENESIKLDLTNETEDVDEISIFMNQEQVESIQEQEKDFIIQTKKASFMFSEDVLKNFSEDFEISIKKVTDTDLEEVQEAMHEDGVEVEGKGASIKVETNLNQQTEMTLPIEQGDELTAEDLRKLGVYVIHSDGDREFVSGKVAYDDDGKVIGLTIRTEKFSTFTVVETTEPRPHYSWHTRYDVNQNKVWNIEMSAPVDQATVNQQTIYVEDQQGNKVDTEVNLVDEQTISVKRVKWYESGQTYTLVITDGIKDTEGKAMDETVKMPFEVE